MKKIDKSMYIMEVLEIHDGLGDILAASGLHCIGCASSTLETLEEASEVHGIDVDVLVDKLNEYLVLLNA